jgi:integral membrane protein
MLKFLTTSIGRFRVISFLEGISFGILIFIAVPLKYLFDKPEFVKMYGSLHGGFFLLFGIYLLICKFEYNWKMNQTVKLLLLSFVPFGNFYADRKYLRHIQ